MDAFDYEPELESFGDGPFFADPRGGADSLPTAFRLRGEDRPFRPNVHFADPAAMTAALDLPIGPAPAVNAAIQALAANLVDLEHVGDAQWLFYSRDNNHYAERRYVPDFYRRATMIEAVDRLEQAGLIEHRRTRPSPQALFRSRLRTTPKMRSRICALPATAIVFDPREVIVLRGADKLPTGYRETAATRAMRRDVITHNEFLRDFEITICHPEACINEQGYLGIKGCRLNLARNTYYRVFKVRFTQCGRWYGPWWQNVPSHIRQGIHINGQPTCEPDIRGCHMRLLCAVAGVGLAEGDPYEGLGLPRNEVKLAINVMLNASSWPSARGALIERLASQYGPAVGTQVEGLRTGIAARFPALDRFWNTGYGCVLQNIDAGICARLQRRLRERSVPVLSVHDSFIVPRSAESLTVAVMEEEFDTACRRLRQPKR